jgi:site-specific recombinase XerD
VQINKFGRKALESFLQVRADSASNNLFGVSKRTLQRSVEELGKQIGVPDLTCHWLRYTFAKRLQKLGLSDAEICEHTRHGSIAALQRYLRSSAEDLQSAVEGVM